jgi:translation initiation factor IF-2
VGGYEFTGPPDQVPETKPESSGGPPQPPPPPPKLTARDLLEPDEPGRTIFVPEYIEVGELAGLFGLKPFKVVAELIKLGIFKHADELIEFSIADTIAKKYGFSAEKVPFH